MWSGVLQVGLVMALATLFTLDPEPARRLDRGQRHAGDRARTMAFTVLVFAQLFNAFNARSDTAGAFRGLFPQPLALGRGRLEVLLQLAVVQWPGLNPAFGTTALTGVQWGWCAWQAAPCCGSASCANGACAAGMPSATFSVRKESVHANEPAAATDPDLFFTGKAASARPSLSTATAIAQPMPASGCCW